MISGPVSGRAPAAAMAGAAASRGRRLRRSPFPVSRPAEKRARQGTPRRDRTPASVRTPTGGLNWVFPVAAAICVRSVRAVTDGLDDQFAWLEDVEGTDALAWVRKMNAHTEGDLFADPLFTDLRG